MRRSVSLGAAAALFVPSLLFGLTLDFLEGPLSLPNAPQIAVLGGEPVSLRLNARGQVVVRRGEAEQVLAEPRIARGRITLPVLYADPAGLHVFYRVKLTGRVEGLGGPGDKLIYVRSSQDGGKTFGPSQRLNREGGAFVPRVVGNVQGAVYAVWVDERGKRYHVFLNRTADGGKSWQPGDFQVDTRADGGAYDPTLVADGERVWVAWVEGSGGAPASETRREPFRVMVRRSTDQGATWADPVRVAAPEGQPLQMALLRAKGQVFLYWFTAQGIAGARSGDDGQTWTAVTGPSAPQGGQELSGLAAAADPASGRVILAYTVNREAFPSALYAASSAEGTRFEPPVLLPVKTPHLTTAILPEVVTDRSGAVLVLWQDFRYIRSTVCARGSTDGGHTWLPHDVCLEEQPGKFHAYYPKGASDGAGKFHALWVRYTDDRLQKTEVVLAAVDARRAVTPPAAGDATVARLEERVGEFWKTRIAASYGATYDLLDPIFRSRVRREAYVGSQGTVKYYDAKIVKADVTERVAQVRVRYTFEIPELDVQGKRHKVPKRDEETVQEWVWMDGDWYLVFKDVMNQTFFRY